MASYNTAIKMVEEFFDGKDSSSAKRRSLYIDRHGESGEGLYSYGDHYPVMLDTEQGVLVNLHNVSVTTTTQRNGVIAGLEKMGYRATGNKVVDPVTRYEFMWYAPAQG